MKSGDQHEHKAEMLRQMLKFSGEEMLEEQGDLLSDEDDDSELPPALQDSIRQMIAEKRAKEQAAQAAEDATADLEDAVKRAEAAAQRAESLAPTEGLVNSVNGKGGVVVLDAYDVGALPSPATTAGVEAGMFLTVKEVTAEGKIITEAVEPPNDAGFVEIAENIPAEQRKAGVLYGLVVMDLSAETEPATFNN